MDNYAGRHKLAGEIVVDPTWRLKLEAFKIVAGDTRGATPDERLADRMAKAEKLYHWFLESDDVEVIVKLRRENG